MRTKPAIILTVIVFLSGCTNWGYQTKGEEVTFEIRSWNHDPIIRKIEGVEIPTFRVLKDGYALDGLRVYYKGDTIPNAIPETFQILGRGYSKDSKNIFLYTCQLLMAAPEYFVILEGVWSKDNERVFHGYEVVPEANADSFNIVSDAWAIDNNNAYHALSWVALGCKGSEYLNVKVFRNIESDTFHVVDSFNAKDGKATYQAH